MKLLLDTHAFLWFVGGDIRLSGAARTAIEDNANTKYVSAATVWEMAIKISIDKLTLAKPLDGFLVEHLDGNGFTTLNVQRSHAELVVSLPFHHRDPFDRILVAQCLVDDMVLVSTDSIIDLYGVRRIW